MHTEHILSKLNSMPAELKKEVLDFMEHLLEKHEKNKQKQALTHPKYGSCKGLFVIPDDFDEPLDDFKEYM